MSAGAELSVLMPIINAPFRLYYAYNPLRLYERPYCNDVVLGQEAVELLGKLITRAMFPPGGAGDLHLPGSHPGLRSAVRLPRAAQDLPPHHLDNLLTSVHDRLTGCSLEWPVFAVTPAIVGLSLRRALCQGLSALSGACIPSLKRQALSASLVESRPIHRIRENAV